MKKFFAVYDLQMDGFKAGMTGTDPKRDDRYDG